MTLTTGNTRESPEHLALADTDSFCTLDHREAREDVIERGGDVLDVIFDSDEEGGPSCFTCHAKTYGHHGDIHHIACRILWCPLESWRSPPFGLLTGDRS